MSYREDIGNQIQTMRVQLGLTKEELARMCGMTPLNVTKIENGVYNVPIDVVGKIADALNAELVIKKKPIEYPKTVRGWREEIKRSYKDCKAVKVKPDDYCPQLVEHAFRADDLTEHSYDDMKVIAIEVLHDKGIVVIFV